MAKDLAGALDLCGAQFAMKWLTESYLEKGDLTIEYVRHDYDVLELATITDESGQWPMKAGGNSGAE